MRRPVRDRLLFFAFASATFLSAAPRGGVLRIALRAEPKTFNPVIALDAPSRDVIRRLHADLITIDRASQKTVPSLAESWSVAGNQYTLKLRKNVRFSDGAPFTADDVLFSFAVYADEKIRSPQRDLLLIRNQPIDVKKLDPHTVTFQLPGPYAAAERIFDSVAILPKHKLEAVWKSGKLRDAWTLNTPASEIVGLGPFRLKEYRPGETVRVERNPYYWKPDRPHLDGLEFQLLADEDLQLARFASGDIHLLNRLTPKAVAYLERRPDAQIVDLGPSLEYNFLAFNLSPNSPHLPAFNKREFREALSLAADRDAIVNLVFQKRATAIWGHVSPGNKLWFSNKIPHPARSIDTARARLKSAGFTWNPAGTLLDPAGAPVTFSILVSSSSHERQQMAVLLQADWKQLGIAVTITPLEFRALLDRVLNTRQFDTCLLGLGGGDADPNPEMGVWQSSGAMHLWNPNQKSPATKWEAELDSLMQNQMGATNPVERFRLYARVQEIVAAEQPMIFLVSPNVVVARANTVGNFRPAVLDHQTLWNVEDLFLSKGGPAK